MAESPSEATPEQAESDSPGDGEFITRDLSLAAYLAEHGLTLRMAEKDPRTGHFRFVLEDPFGDAEELKVEWSNSCCFKHEKRLLSIKAIMRSGPRTSER